jgi:large subunit ribosomal protein L15
MQIHQLQPTKKRKPEKRLGRGRKRGTYCGRGVKGQKSRAGRKMKPIIRDILKRYPKKRGYRFSASKNYEVLNLRDVERKFNEGEKISPKVLVEKKLIRARGGKIPTVKILGKGELTKSLVFENLTFSKSAKEKIEKAKGKIL